MLARNQPNLIALHRLASQRRHVDPPLLTGARYDDAVRGGRAPAGGQRGDVCQRGAATILLALVRDLARGTGSLVLGLINLKP
jgi:hypothetical protein